MRHHLNTIYITSENAWLRKDGANLVVEVEGKEKGRAPLHMIEGIVSFSRPGASPALMAACADSKISISFLTPEGKFQARVEGPQSGNVLLRRTHYRRADDTERSTAIVRCILTAKTANQRTVIKRCLRDYGETLEPDSLGHLQSVSERLDYISRRSIKAEDVDSLRGYEGEAAQTYFSAFDLMIRGSKPDFSFRGRSRRPPLDRVNALLSFLYAMLGHDCRSALESVGLDPQVGFLHRDRPGRAGLALDLMEEFRPVLADRLALTLINRGQIRAQDFKVEHGGAVRLTDDGRKTALIAWQERKKRELRHAFLQEAMPMGLVPHVQSLLLARHLRGDIDGYPAWIWK